jgi:hypothetical protein
MKKIVGIMVSAVILFLLGEALLSQPLVAESSAVTAVSIVVPKGCNVDVSNLHDSPYFAGVAPDGTLLWRVTYYLNAHQGINHEPALGMYRSCQGQLGLWVSPSGAYYLYK